MINWKTRLANKTFWLTLIPALLLLIQLVLASFGITFEIEVLEFNLVGIVNALFAVLAILGIVVDPTTLGISDSPQALTYDKPDDGTQATNYYKS